MKETTKEGVLTFGFMIKYYVHRYIRLAPPLMIMLMISLTLTKYLGSGPFYPSIFNKIFFFRKLIRNLKFRKWI